MKARLLKNPGFSTTDRTGWICEVVELKDKHGTPYLALKDELGVSWPPSEGSYEIIDEQLPDLGISIGEEVATKEDIS